MIRVYNFKSDQRKTNKRVTWADGLSDMETTDGDETSGLSADEGPSSRELYEWAA